ncbi:hypothetical protein J1N35_014325 [Gossypium stocksii]|uniref:Uncharacterized protein n=1 Tax=Gossypium stocksii TaxID=47602 RepID=A0A9D3VW66_9ROSI|nr:hypothetical protein J1N35_014325 [Gossypium stocksii]
MGLINNRTRMDVSRLVVMVWEMMDRDWEVTVQFSPSIMNMAVYFMAIMSKNLSIVLFIFEEPLHEMAATLLQDCLGLRVLPAECYG